MVEKLVENQFLFYATGLTIVLGILCKGIVAISLKRLVKAASNMAKSNHSLMRLVRAKFEHTCMVSEKVQNVSAFVDKYVYEYKVLWIPLYSLRQLEKTMIWLCGIFSVAGGILSYSLYGELSAVQNYVVLGGCGIAVLLLLQVTLTESAKLDVAKMYMVDFLENTYAHRYEKTTRRETVKAPAAAEEQTAPQNEVVVESPAFSEPVQKEVPEYRAEERAKAQRIAAEQTPKEARKKDERKEILPQVEPEMEVQPVQADKIREILEEFLA